MAVDYLFVELIVFVVIALAFFILGLAEEFPQTIVYHMLSTIFSFGSALLWIATSETWGQVGMWGFFLIGTLNFIFVILHSLQELNTKKAKRWSAE